MRSLRRRLAVAKLQRLYSRVSPYVDLARGSLDDLSKARNGGAYAKASAVVSIAGRVWGVTIGGDNKHGLIHEVLKDGAIEVESSLEYIIRDAILSMGPPDVQRDGGSHTAHSWSLGDGFVHVIADLDDGPSSNGTIWVCYDKECEQALYEVVAAHVWRDKTEILLTQHEDGVEIHAMSIEGDYVEGPVTVDDLAGRIGRDDEPRVMLIRGPTGAGKSILARLISKNLRGGSARTLKIGRDDFGATRASDVQDIARWIQPSIILLDDFRLHEDNIALVDKLLDALEAVHVGGAKVIITMMVDRPSSDAPSRGEFYVEGLRPGRIDEVVELGYPDREHRVAILCHYLDKFGAKLSQSEVEHVVNRMPCVTAPYLCEAAKRARRCSGADLDREIDAILWSAPPIDDE